MEQGKLIINFKTLVFEKQLAEKRRLSLLQIAKETGLSYNTIKSWENGTVSRFDTHVITSLCEFFNCSLSQLIEYVPAEKA